MTTGDRTLDADEIALIDRTLLARSTRVGRLAGSVLVVVGLVAAAGWAWAAVRQQQDLSDAFIGFNAEPGASFADRLDLAAATLGLLVNASLLVGIGLLLRLLSDHVALAAGTSPLGLEVGDPSPLDDNAGGGAPADQDESQQEPSTEID